MLPGEADAAHHLDHRARHPVVGLRRIGLRQARHRDQVVAAAVGSPRCIHHRRPRRLHLHQHVGTLVGDRLEGADRPTELHPHLRILHADIHAALRAAERLCSQQNRTPLQHPSKRRGAALRAHNHGLFGHRGVDLQHGEVAAPIHRRTVHHLNPLVVGRQRNQQRSRVALRGHHQQPSGGTFDDLTRTALKPDATIFHPPAEPCTPVGLVGQRGGDRALRDLRKPGRCSSRLRTLAQRHRTQRRRKQRAGRDHTAQLLHHRGERHDVEPHAAKLLANQQTAEPELRRQTGPDLSPCALFVAGLRRLQLARANKKAAHTCANGLLIIVQAKVHRIPCRFG